MSAYSRGVAWAESALTPLAERLVMALEDPADEVLGPRTPVRDLEAELLQGTATEVAAARAARSQALGGGAEGGGGSSVVHSESGPPTITPSEAMQLRKDCERLLQQREQLRARLIAEQERRERAEAELVNIGAQWLGTETQEALRQRAEAEKQRALDAAREAIQREADQRVSKLEAERSMLLQRLGKASPVGSGHDLDPSPPASPRASIAHIFHSRLHRSHVLLASAPRACRSLSSTAPHL